MFLKIFTLANSLMDYTTKINCRRHIFVLFSNSTSGFPSGSDGKESAASVGDLGSTIGLGRAPREGNGNSLQYSCLGNPMDRRAWQETVHRVAKSQTQLKRLSTHACNPAKLKETCGLEDAFLGEREKPTVGDELKLNLDRLRGSRPAKDDACSEGTASRSGWSLSLE